MSAPLASPSSHPRLDFLTDASTSSPVLIGKDLSVTEKHDLFERMNQQTIGDAVKPPDKKWLVVAAQNTAVDRTCSILLTSKTLMVIRAHPEALEFGEMLKSAQKQAQGVLLPADPESDAESESDGEEMTLHAVPAAETDSVPTETPGPEPDPQENDDWNAIPDDAPIEYTQSILNQCENILKNRGLITKISDDRLKLVENSLYAWVLRFAGLFDCPFVRN
ncbi:MAG: hypothetical protein Q9192_006305 [Flavoplaca navasiana]